MTDERLAEIQAFYDRFKSKNSPMVHSLHVEMTYIGELLTAIKESCANV